MQISRGTEREGGRNAVAPQQEAVNAACVLSRRSISSSCLSDDETAGKKYKLVG